MAPVVPFIPLIAAGLTAAGTIGATALQKTPKAPTPEKPKVMPTADDAAIQETRRRRSAMAQQQSGLASSVLTTGSRETLG